MPATTTAIWLSSHNLLHTPSPSPSPPPYTSRRSRSCARCAAPAATPPWPTSPSTTASVRPPSSRPRRTAAARWAGADLSPWSGQTVTATFALNQAEGAPPASVTLSDASLGSWRTAVVEAVAPQQVAVGGATLTLGWPEFPGCPNGSPAQRGHGPGDGARGAPPQRRDAGGRRARRARAGAVSRKRGQRRGRAVRSGRAAADWRAPAAAHRGPLDRLRSGNKKRQLPSGKLSLFLLASHSSQVKG